MRHLGMPEPRRNGPKRTPVFAAWPTEWPDNGENESPAWWIGTAHVIRYEEAFGPLARAFATVHPDSSGGGVITVAARSVEAHPERTAPSWQSLQNIATNNIISGFADGKRISYMDIGNTFLQPDGTLPKEIMPDQLHLSPKGYRIWADAVAPTLKELMGS